MQKSTFKIAEIWQDVVVENYNAFLWSKVYLCSVSTWMMAAKVRWRTMLPSTTYLWFCSLRWYVSVFSIHLQWPPRVTLSRLLPVTGRQLMVTVASWLTVDVHPGGYGWSVSGRTPRWINVTVDSVSISFWQQVHPTGTSGTLAHDIPPRSYIGHIRHSLWTDHMSQELSLLT